MIREAYNFGYFVMQETRQQILEILEKHAEVTVNSLVAELRKRRGDFITPVTVRHHLSELLNQNLIIQVEPQHRNSRGRPQHVYVLTELARDFLPHNYQLLAINLLTELSDQLPASKVNVILEGVADRMCGGLGIALDTPLPARLDEVVAYLNQQGYNARWEDHPEGFVLYTANCPYHHVVKTSRALCEMDMRLVTSLLGIVPRLMTRISQGDTSCSYMIPHKSK
jgi:predicted ArsR family transcriptional regulator